MASEQSSREVLKRFELKPWLRAQRAGGWLVAALTPKMSDAPVKDAAPAAALPLHSGRDQDIQFRVGQSNATMPHAVLPSGAAAR